MLANWNLEGLSYDNQVTFNQYVDYMPVEPPYPIDTLKAE